MALGGFVGCGGRPPEPEPLRDEYDACIIGSGFAGTLLGLRLAESNLHTILVEAGNSSEDLQSGDGPLANEFRVDKGGSVAYPVKASRVIGVGGTSQHWTGVLTRLMPSDFKQRSLFGMSVDWPIEFADLESFYCDAEQALSVRGYPPTPGEPPRACAYPLSRKGAYEAPVLNLSGRTPSFFQVGRSERGRDGDAVRLLDEEVPRFEASPFGTLLSERQVTRLVPGSREAISHVEARAKDGSTRTIRAKVFVVAAGVIESPRLLLASRSRHFPEGIGNGNDLVGRFFGVHPTLMKFFDLDEDERLPIGVHRTLDFNDAFRRRGLNACQLQLNTYQSGIVQVKLQPELQARAENRIALSRTIAGESGLPLPRLVLDYSERDRETFEEATALMDEALRLMTPNADSLRLTQRWRYHPSGTCRMGFDETNGVVDARGKVFGVDNLYVSGASVFPTAGTGNPTLTVVALTLRLADHLLDTFPAFR